MNVAAWQPVSLLDYPDRIAATLFTPGCTLRCPFCHNPDLVIPDLVEQVRPLDSDALLARLGERVGFLDGVVITGGEPTLQADLAAFVARVKKLGFLVKLDTNGTRPAVLEDLLKRGLVDFVAMDIKAPRARYAEFCGVPVDLRVIETSIARLRAASIDVEFRTTVAPGLHAEDLLEAAAWIDGADAYWLQAFRSPEEKGLVDPAWAAREALGAEALRAVWRAIASRFRTGGVRA